MIFSFLFRLRAEEIPGHNDTQNDKDHLENIHRPNSSVAASPAAGAALRIPVQLYQLPCIQLAAFRYPGNTRKLAASFGQFAV